DSYKRRLNSWLRRQSRYGAMLCALDHAVWLFAEAGLYPEQTQISANREILGAMQEKFPRLDVQGTLYSISRNRMTCGGHTATLDMFLDFISQTCGEGLVQVLLSEMLYSSIRQGDTLQSDSLSAGNWKMHPMLNRALNVMVTNIERPLSLREVARRAGISLRQLEQLARNSNALMPSRQYLEVRLAHARETLIYTDMTISEIALATGFSALSAFSRAFGARFQSSPRDYRNRFRKRMMRPFIR
ncbi:MAG: helix-turn-helix domain-containing protein, partial [Mesorhizobium sp.]